MGNCTSNSKPKKKEPENFFMREKWNEQIQEDIRKKNANPVNKRVGVKEPVVVSTAILAQAHQINGPVAAPAPTHVRAYQAEAIERIRYQLNNDANAFLLNNILLSVQFFENYEREVHHIKRNPISEREHAIDDAMLQHHKHVFFADRLQECVQEHVSYQKSLQNPPEPLTSSRLFIIYDNVEASEPGDTSDYSAVLDAPFYKLRIEDCKEPGYVKLKKLEVLKNTASKDETTSEFIESDASLYADSEKESLESDDNLSINKGEELLKEIKNRIDNVKNEKSNPKPTDLVLNHYIQNHGGRRISGPMKHYSTQVTKSNISNINNLRLNIKSHNEGDEIPKEALPRKSNLKTKGVNAQKKDIKSLNEIDAKSTSLDQCAEDTETSGYRSNSSSRQSEAESDYGYATITQSTTPKKVQLSTRSVSTFNSGVLSDECWDRIQVKLVDNWSDDEDEDVDTTSKLSLSRSLYETNFYLNSFNFMTSFIDNFMVQLGFDLKIPKESVKNALTQGASIYYNLQEKDIKACYEVYPALLAAWPNTANPWIIRERRIIQNPRTNFTYQWPTKYMVGKAIGYGCLLIPVGFRPKRGLNSEQRLQWKIIFPTAERFLESCLAHSHIRCYLFALTLYKTFLDNESSKIGLDVSHIKNHLFWQCENNYAGWPEDRLGESLRIFLETLYSHFAQSRFPNYFMENCNDFKSIPKPILLKLQKKLADILEAPVTHILKAIEKIKYVKKDYYPSFNCHRLYNILTCKNPLRIINPNLPEIIQNENISSDSEDDVHQFNFWDQVKSRDKQYQWNKEKHRQIQQRKRVVVKKQKSAPKQDIEIKNMILPSKLDSERRRLVLEFFIPHFIAMARSSEKFEAINQAIIYLEQAQRLCTLLNEEHGGEITANEYLDVIRDKLADCQRKLVDQSGYKLPPRKDVSMDRVAQMHKRRRHRPKYENIVNQNSPNEENEVFKFTFAEVHTDNNRSTLNNNTKTSVKLLGITDISEESRL